MTIENLNKGKDLLRQIEYLEGIKSKIQIEYDKQKDSALKQLLSDCNDVCSNLKEVKEKKFAEL